MKIGCCQTPFCTSFLGLYELLILFVILYSAFNRKYQKHLFCSFTIDTNSHLMAAAVPDNVSGWIYVRTLGSGGFGAVYLYRNEVCVAANSLYQTSTLVVFCCNFFC